MPATGPEILLSARSSGPFGSLRLYVRRAALVALAFPDAEPETERWLERRFGAITVRGASDPGSAVSRLEAYFDGQLSALDGIVADTGGTPFQQAVWEALRTIPAGRVWSYAELARAIDRPKAQRAVGAANGQNPVPIVVPCHRVVASNGSLWGYGGGLELKRRLLEHEGALPAVEARTAQQRLF